MKIRVTEAHLRMLAYQSHMRVAVLIGQCISQASIMMHWQLTLCMVITNSYFLVHFCSNLLHITKFGFMPYSVAFKTFELTTVNIESVLHVSSTLIGDL